MSISKYQILNPLTDRKKPYYDNVRNQLVIPVKRKYKYYIEAAQYNYITTSKDYFILLGVEKFDDNCKRCEVDGYGKCRISIKGEIKEYIIDTIKDLGNITVEYQETDGLYDVFNVV